jgi:hypothetical protein
MQMLEMIATSSANSVQPVPATTSSAATITNQTSETPSTSYNTGNNEQQTTVTSSNRSGKNSPAANTQSSMSQITGTLSDSSNIDHGAEDTNGPLPAFEKAFGSTEIGRYSHEGFFNTTQQTENQQSTNNEVSISSAPDYSYYMGPTQIPAFESTMHYHQNQLQTVNQYSGFYNYYNYNYNEFHQHFNYSHNQFSQLNPWTSAPIKYENVLNY